MQTQLTDQSAMLLYLLFHYELEGESCTPFSLNKLAYLLQEAGEPFNLSFTKIELGLYSAELMNMLKPLNGTYLNNLETDNAKAFEEMHLNYEKWEEVKSHVETKLNQKQRFRLHSVTQLIKGFESSFSIELLSTVDYLMKHETAQNPDELMTALSSWSNRKKEIFNRREVEITYNHLKEHRNLGSASLQPA